jgi:Ser/Thr protein kinase RdoA (MazF antagonist)
MLSKLITDNYGIEIKNIKFFDEQKYGDQIFLAESESGKYIVKAYNIFDSGSRFEDEGKITELVRNNGISTPKFLKTKNGKYSVRAETEEMQFHVQEFVEGEILQLNTAPEWFLEKSAQTLGKIRSVLKDYEGLPTHFDSGFFSKATTDERKNYFTKLMEEAKNKQESAELIGLFENRLKHLERISQFNIDADKLTYSASHGWFHIGELIVRNQDITVIDWTGVSRKPVSYEIMMSYVFASPECKNGRIDSDRLKRYINNHSKYFALSDYDIQIMPYLYYYAQMICNYEPGDNTLPDWWKDKCELIINVTDWLYENAEILAKALHEK